MGLKFIRKLNYGELNNMKDQKGEACAMLIIITFMISAIAYPLSQKLPDIIDHGIGIEKQQQKHEK